MLPKIGILCAGDDELAPFLPLLDRRSVRRQAMLTIHEGWISSVPAAALYSGVCKVNAAIAAQVLIDSCRVEAIINAGTAGGIDPSISIFDTVISTETAYHDMESAAVAHVCHANGIPFLSIRTITDSADRSAAACFEENCRRASEIAAQVTHALLKRLAVSESYPIEKGELP